MTETEDYSKVATPKAHAASHQDGGSDEVNVDALSGELADEQNSAWDKVSGKPTTFPPDSTLPHKATHQYLGADELNLEGLVGKSLYVPRGDPSAWDFSKTDLTTDGNWHDLNLASVIAQQAKLVHLRITIKDNLTDQTLSFRKKGNSNEYNCVNLRTQAANIAMLGEGFVECDINRYIQYKASNITWTYLYILVRGYFI